MADLPDLRSQWEKAGGTPEQFLRKAAWRGDVPLCRRALRSVSSVDDADEHGRTALHCATESGHTEVSVSGGVTLTTSDCAIACGGRSER